MNIEKLQAELEQLFDLEDLLEATRRTLGIEPSELGSTIGLGAYIRALTSYCAETGSIEALCDAVAFLRPAASEELRAIPRVGLAETPLTPGTDVAGFVIERELGTGPSGISYAATRAGSTEPYRVKLLSPAAHYDVRGIQRFQTFNRLAAELNAPGLPEGLTQTRSGRQLVLSHRFIEGQSLAKLLARTGALRLEDAERVLRPVLEALRALHDKGLTHGNIKLENIIVEGELSAPRVLLLDAGFDRLRSRAPHTSRGEILSLSSPKTVAPEVLRGAASTPRSDLYSLGVVLFELLTGNAPFSAQSSLEFAFAHLSETPGLPSDSAPKGLISPEMDQLLLDLLSKQPEDRPRDARRMLEALDVLVLRRSQRPPPPDADIDASIDQLLQNPTDEAAALALESLAASGADTRRIADCLKIAFEQIPAEDPAGRDAKIDLAFRAGRLFRACGELEQAETVYAALLRVQPHDRVARTALEDLLRDLQKFDELIDFWLEQAERAEAPVERAEFLSRIGTLYEHELADQAQARIAHCQALCAFPEATEHAQAVVRLAGTHSEAWAEVLEICGDAVQHLSPDERKPLLLIMASWYADRMNRFDLAMQCYATILTSDPTSAAALDGQARLYRKGHQWNDLAQLLLRRAEFAPSPATRRDLLVEAAEVFESRLAEQDRAAALYERVLDEDPLHRDALEALRSTYHRTQNYGAYTRLLRKQLLAARGAERQSLLCRLAEAHDQHLGDPDGALQYFREVLSESVSNMEALRGMALIYLRQGNNDELLKNLKQQFEFASTPRQKATLALSIAELLEKEFLDQRRAIESYEVVLELDPNNHSALSNLARAYRSQKRWHDVGAILSRHVESTDDPAVKAQLHLGRAEAHQQLGEIPQAIAAYEVALAHAPGDAHALRLLAALQQLAGDASEALRSLETLANTAPTVEGRVEHLLQAGRMLAERKDLAAAVERYQRALELIPNHPVAATELRQAYLVLGDSERAVQSIISQISAQPPGPARAKLTAELALLLLDHDGPRAQAEQAAREALEWNEASIEALFVLGSLAYQAEHYADAVQHFSRLMHSLDSISLDRAVDATVRYIDAACKLGAAEAAVDPARRLQALAPDNPKALLAVAEALFEAGIFDEALPVFERLVKQFGKAFPTKEAAEIAVRYAECVRRSGNLDHAMALFEDAFDLNEKAQAPLLALAEILAEREQWNEVWDVKRRLLELTDGEARVELLLDLAELAATKLGDRARAASSFVAALDARPGDRKILSRLMQIYTEERDWANTLDVVLKLADFVDDEQQKARYLMTAGMISLRELNDPDTALDCYERALKLDPTLDKALDASAKILLDREDFQAMEVLFKRKMKTATAARDTQKTLDAFLRLGTLYKVHMHRTESAIDAFEAAATLDPKNRDAKDALFELYLSNPPKYFTKARDLQLTLLEEEPYRAEPYKALRRLYTELKNADGAWCLCQALCVLRLAEPDEERFYKRMRSDDPAYAQAVLSDDDYRRILHPEELDPLLSELFAWIEPAVIASRGYEFFELGYDPNLAVDLARHAYPIGQTLHYAAGVMGMPAPPCFDNTNDPGGLAFLDTRTPAVSMGLGVLTGEIHPQAIAFLAGRHLTFYRPGFFLRQLVGTGTGLKSWLFAAIKLISPQFPVSPDLEGPVAENAATLSSALAPHARDALARVVSKLIQSGGALDMKKWVSAVDQTADRVGFLLCHDLETAVEVMRRSGEDAGEATERRVRDLVQFSISPGYLELRQHLQVNLAI